jgi:hypothetical protein
VSAYRGRSLHILAGRSVDRARMDGHQANDSHPTCGAARVAVGLAVNKQDPGPAWSCQNMNDGVRSSCLRRRWPAGRYVAFTADRLSSSRTWPPGSSSSLAEGQGSVPSSSGNDDRGRAADVQWQARSATKKPRKRGGAHVITRPAVSICWTNVRATRRLRVRARVDASARSTRHCPASSAPSQ